MSEFDKALADIVAIRNQIAAGTAFRGFGPAALAATGLVALATAAAQSQWLEDPDSQPLAFLAGWVAAAILSVAIIGIEMVRRAQRHHSGLSDAMILTAAEQFLPAGAAGALLTVVIWRFAPEAFWMLPGLWLILVGLGIFSSLRSLPRSVALAGAWYVLTGLVVLVIQSASHGLSPWTMGLPFAAGQFMMAAILHLAFGGTDAED